MASIDLFLFRQINNLAGRFVFLDQIGIFLAVHLIKFLPLIIISAYFLYRNRQDKRKIVLIIINSFLTLFIVEILKNFIWTHFPKPRPFFSLEVNQLISVGRFSTFPSGHASFAFVWAFSAYLFNQKMGWPLIILAFFVGLGRIFVGVHYPSDILGGAFLGLLCSLFIKKFLTNKLITYNL